MKTLFIGDSITEGFDLEKFFPGKDFSNRGLSGYSTSEVLNAIDRSWFAGKPEYVFVCLGTNDLARDYDEADTLDTVEKLLIRIYDFAPENAVVFLTSLFPTRHNPPRPNPVIRKLNDKLKLLAQKKEKVTFWDIHAHFSDSNGQLKREFTHDGLHLNEEAYRRWAGLIADVLGNYS